MSKDQKTAKWKDHQAALIDHHKAKVASLALAPVNVNTSTRDELVLVPGLSVKQVDALIKSRNEGAWHRSLEDLHSVPGLGAKTIKNISPFIKFDRGGRTPGTSASSTAYTVPPSSTRDTDLPSVSETESYRSCASCPSAGEPRTLKPINPSRKGRKCDTGPVHHVNISLYQGLVQSTLTVLNTLSRRASARMKYWTLAIAKSLPKLEFWCDSACDRGVSGPGAHRGMREVLAVYGLKPVKEEVAEKFIFGDGETKTSKFRYVYPVGLGGKYCGKLGQACIDVPCPLLLSHAVMKNWKVNSILTISVPK